MSGALASMISATRRKTSRKASIVACRCTIAFSISGRGERIGALRHERASHRRQPRVRRRICARDMVGERGAVNVRATLEQRRENGDPDTAAERAAAD